MEIIIKQKNKTKIKFDTVTGKILDNQKSSIIVKKAVIYCRVSSDNQVKDGHGLTSQESICRNWCETNDVEVAEVFRDEGVSGAKLSRPGMNAAIDFLMQKNKTIQEIRYFVCTEESRISRSGDLMEALGLDSRIRSTGVDIIYSFGNIDTSTDEGKMLNQFKYIIASQERQRIYKRALAGKVDRIKQGYWPFPSVPVGYEKMKDGGKSRLVLDPFKAEILGTGLRMYANDELGSQVDLYNYWVKHGLRTNSKLGSGKLHFSFLTNVFQLPKLYFYAGYILLPVWGINEPIQALHAPIISMEIMQKILKKLHGRKVKAPKRPKKELERFALRGLVKCSECKCYIQSWLTKNRYGTLYPYYGCTTRQCVNRANIRQEKFEASFVKKIKKITVKPNLLPLFERCLRKIWEVQNASAGKIHSNDIIRITKIEKRQQEILNQLPNIKIPGLLEAIQYEWLKLDEEKKTLESAKDEKIISETQLSTFIEKGKAILSNPVELWHTSTRKQRLQLIKVRYGEDLYHCKNKGFRTTETAGFHQLFWTIVNTSFPSNTIDRSYFKLLDAIFHERNGSNLTLEEHVNLFFRLIDGTNIENI